MAEVCRYHKDPVEPGTDVWGYTVFGAGEIYIRRTCKGFDRVSQVHAFWHEYFHMLLHHAGRERLKYDETLVDSLGSLQHQALASMKF